MDADAPTWPRSYPLHYTETMVRDAVRASIPAEVLTWLRGKLPAGEIKPGRPSC
jgi:hypothetical protein